MRFMLMIKGNKDSEAGVMPTPELLVAMGKFNEELIASGAMVAGEGLHPTSNGFRLVNARGKITVTDGPFTEAKEIVAGFWILDLPSKEDAVAWAKKVPFEAGAVSNDPNAKGQIEIRAMHDPGPMPGALKDDSAPKNKPIGTSKTKPKIRYFMAFKGDANSEAGVMPPVETMQAMGVLMDDLAKSGALVDGGGLSPSKYGARVFYDAGKRTVTDGPFAEAKELIAGYCIVDVDSQEEALAWARRGVEVNGDCLSEVRRVYGAADFGDLQNQVPEVFEKERAFRERTES